MAENGFSASDAVLTSAMSGGFNNGFSGGGSWGGGYGGVAPFASTGSNAVRIEKNADLALAGNKCIEGVLGANLDRISDQNKETRDTLRFDSIKDGQFQGEIRNGDRLRDIEREMTANARTAAECCCDTQKELLKMELENQKCCCETQKMVVSEASATRELINQNTIRAAVDANNVSSTISGITANANANTNAIIQAIHSIASWDSHGCPNQTGETVILCYNDETIEVPQAIVKTMLSQGATCGSCCGQCCPDQHGKKIDMCLNGNTINVSRNACKGILNAGGACGPCDDKTVKPKKAKTTKKSKAKK